MRLALFLVLLLKCRPGFSTEGVVYEAQNVADYDQPSTTEPPIEVDTGSQNENELLQMFPPVFVLVPSSAHNPKEHEATTMPNFRQHLEDNGRTLFEQAKKLYHIFFESNLDHQARYKQFTKMLLKSADDGGDNLVKFLKERGLLHKLKAHTSIEASDPQLSDTSVIILPVKHRNMKFKDTPDVETYYDFN